jgi:hypothetical protein
LKTLKKNNLLFLRNIKISMQFCFFERKYFAKFKPAQTSFSAVQSKTLFITDQMRLGLGTNGKKKAKKK